MKKFIRTIHYNVISHFIIIPFFLLVLSITIYFGMYWVGCLIVLICLVGEYIFLVRNRQFIAVHGHRVHRFTTIEHVVYLVIMLLTLVLFFILLGVKNPRDTILFTNNHGVNHVSFRYSNAFSFRGYSSVSDIENPFFGGWKFPYQLKELMQFTHGPSNMSIFFGIFDGGSKSLDTYKTSVEQITFESKQPGYKGISRDIRFMKGVEQGQYHGWRYDFSTSNIGAEFFFTDGEQLYIFSYECVSDACLSQGKLFFDDVIKSLR